MSVQSYTIIEQRMKHIQDMLVKLEQLNQVLRAQHSQLERELEELRAQSRVDSNNIVIEPMSERVAQ